MKGATSTVRGAACPGLSMRVHAGQVIIRGTAVVSHHMKPLMPERTHQSGLVGRHRAEAVVGEIGLGRRLAGGAVAAQIGADHPIVGRNQRPVRSVPRAPWSADGRVAAAPALPHPPRNRRSPYSRRRSGPLSKSSNILASPLRCDYSASSARAIPWPPPMHSVTMPFDSPSRFIEWRSRVVRIAPVAPIA